MKITQAIHYLERFFKPGDEEALEATKPTSEQLASWEERGLISTLETVAASGESALERLALDIVALVRPHSQPGEGVVQTVERIVTEWKESEGEAEELRTLFQGQLDNAHETIRDLESRSGVTSNREGESPASSQPSQPPTETPVTGAELSEATNAKVGLALLDKGFGTKEKIRAASDGDLKAIEGLGDTMVAKLRELAK